MRPSKGQAGLSVIAVGIPGHAWLSESTQEGREHQFLKYSGDEICKAMPRREALGALPSRCKLKILIG